MRLPRHFLPHASRLFLKRSPKLLLYLQLRRPNRHIAYQSTLSRPPPAAILHPPQLDEGLKDLYDKDHSDFYDKYLAEKSVHDPFADQSLNQQYPYAEPQPLPTEHGVPYEDFSLSRKATGSILLRVYKASTATSNSPVILYFPSRGTNPLPTTNEHKIISHLTHLTNSTTISVGYRISPPFPLSLHDALAAVDWARANVPAVSLDEYCQNDCKGRLMAVLGTGIGGSIAASIGATEGRESGIVAIGAWLPVVDWAFDPLPGIPESELSSIPRSASFSKGFSQPKFKATDEAVQSTYPKLADTPFLSSETLKAVRSHYFAKPEDFTDPFASPLYRFSTSGVNIWTNLVSRMEVELLADPDNPPAWIRQLPDTVFKRGPRRPIPYPPLNLLGKLTVPMMRIVSAEGDILHKQTTEYVEAARCSMFPYAERTIEAIELAEARELGKTHNNDVEPVELLDSKGWSIPGEEDHTAGNENKTTIMENSNTDDASWSHILEDEPTPPKYSKAAETYIHHEIIPRASHCLITGADEIKAGLKEVESMAEWINGVFENEPRRAAHWKRQQELWKQIMEEKAKSARQKRASRL